MTPTELVALLTGVIGALGAFWAVLSNARKAETQSLRETMEAISAENERLQKRIAEIHKRTDSIIAERDRLKERVFVLEGQVESMRGELDYLRCENNDYRAIMLKHGLTEEQILHEGCEASFAREFPAAYERILAHQHHPQDGPTAAAGHPAAVGPTPKPPESPAPPAPARKSRKRPDQDS